MDIWSVEKRSEVMALVTSKNTKPEIRLRKALFSLGYRYRLHNKKLPGKPDIVLPKYRTVIFMHGCFWHRHSNCRAATSPKSNINYWESKFENNIRRDAAHQHALEALGWRVIVVWECELRKDISKAIASITDNLI
ncbi:very short patch repair endonuclease [Mucilaginibacter sp. E4BP6]|uniref:very short patch repair endonuclease n=1 Tax=Mucilaginibacter sp. E4BP6 TaxID=2723089 RepID=UPI0015CCA606|nr:DNA mismatch endonuclease Vsr [Mucilaginibacter sp. E4BP6]NYE66910.1 DNA mismatch endonuclease (patch repair protein) [Mucilaginibacter sp. E4BP6]